MSSSSESYTGNSGLSRGIPARCACGSWARRFTSYTSDNPGRPFFRCETMARKDHLFKWVEDALIEEIVDGKGRLGAVDCEVNKLRNDVDSLISEINDLHKVVLEVKGDVKKLRIGLWAGVCVGVLAMAMSFC